MILYPDIEVQNGKCVHLWRGSPEEPVVHSETPLEAACRFVSEGAERLHVTDLDRVFGDGENEDVVVEIIKSAGAFVQVGGGIHSMKQVRHWIDMGAARVVIATAAVKNPGFVMEAAQAFPDQIVVSIDTYDGFVAIDGWRDTTMFTPLEFARQFQDAPLASIILTDINRDIEDPQSSISLVTELSTQIRTPVVASGVVKTLDDVSTLKFLPNIAGAIVGRALFSGAIELSDALRIANEPLPRRAAFM